jgi:AhpD family alkylhydroperoxidase
MPDRDQNQRQSRRRRGVLGADPSGLENNCRAVHNHQTQFSTTEYKYERFFRRWGRYLTLDWNGYQKEIGGRMGELSRLSPETLKGYLTLSGANAKTTLLGEKTRQLISLAVAVTTRCDGCIVFHTDAALQAGASREEISEALGVAVAMNAGAALIYSTRVLDAVEAKGAAAAAK